MENESDGERGTWLAAFEVSFWSVKKGKWEKCDEEHLTTKVRMNRRNKWGSKEEREREECEQKEEVEERNKWR